MWALHQALLSASRVEPCERYEAFWCRKHVGASVRRGTRASRKGRRLNLYMVGQGGGTSNKMMDSVS